MSSISTTQQQIFISTNEPYIYLNIGGFFDLDTNSVRELHAAQMAIEDVNESGFISNYKLQLLKNETK
ncbi:unnamed protein product, partial [Didymodactylos carnosus]